MCFETVSFACAQAEKAKDKAIQAAQAAAAADYERMSKQQAAKAACKQPEKVWWCSSPPPISPRHDLGFLSPSARRLARTQVLSVAVCEGKSSRLNPE